MPRQSNTKDDSLESILSVGQGSESSSNGTTESIPSAIQIVIRPTLGCGTLAGQYRIKNYVNGLLDFLVIDPGCLLGNSNAVQWDGLFPTYPGSLGACSFGIATPALTNYYMGTLTGGTDAGYLTMSGNVCYIVYSAGHWWEMGLSGSVCQFKYRKTVGTNPAGLYTTTSGGGVAGWPTTLEIEAY